MNTLFISPNSPKESVGGIERYLTNLIEFCKSKSNLKTFLILPTNGKAEIEYVENVTIYYTNSLSIPTNTAHAQRELGEKAKLFSELVEKIIQEEKINVICAENFMFGPPAVFSLRLNMVASLYKIPIVLRLHMYAASPIQIELVNQLMWKKVSCVSRSVAGDCFEKGTDINILSTDYLGVNTLEFSENSSRDWLKKDLNLSPNHKIVLTAARLIRGTDHMLKEKGLINLIQAFSKLSPRYPDLRLVFAIGKASDNLKKEFDRAQEMLLGYLKLNHIEDKAILKIFKLEEMPKVYGGSDLFVLPSEMNETFGQVFIEAMSCKLPVIGAKTGGIPEIISDSYNGYLVPPDDSSILAQRMEKLLTSDSVKNQFIKNGLKTVQDNFTAEKQQSSFIDMLEQTASDAKNLVKVSYKNIHEIPSVSTN
jgi:glycosyltransferase involved in cell wall biosynthesis